MKKLLLMTGVILMLFGCQKVQEDEQIIDKWNGYGNFLKNGPVTRTLWAGQNIDCGTIVYEFVQEGDDIVYFSVTYNTTNGWEMSETHMYAGLKSTMLVNKYVNKQLLPKIGLFPFSTNHNPMVTTFNYMIPIVDLPDYDESGFILATHAAVTNVNNGQNETAWGGWDETWNDKRWGGYITDLYQEWMEAPPTLYGIQKDGDDFEILQIDISGSVSNVLSLNPAGDNSYDGLAIMNPNNNPQLFYTAVGNSTNELWIDDLTGVIDPYPAGDLSRVVESAVVYNSNYYYLSSSTIYEITFNTNDQGNLIIATDQPLSGVQVPNGFTAYDMTMTPTGLVYILVSNSAEQLQLNTIDLNTTFYDTNFQPITADDVTVDTQLAYSDGVLYTTSISPTEGLLISSLNPQSSTTNNESDSEIEGGGVIMDFVGGGR